MSKNFQVLLTDEAKSFIQSLDKKLQKKVAYNIQKSREVNDSKVLKKLTGDIWNLEPDMTNNKFGCLHSGIQLKNHT